MTLRSFCQLLFTHGKSGQSHSERSVKSERSLPYSSIIAGIFYVDTQPSAAAWQRCWNRSWWQDAEGRAGFLPGHGGSWIPKDVTKREKLHIMVEKAVQPLKYRTAVPAVTACSGAFLKSGDSAAPYWAIRIRRPGDYFRKGGIFLFPSGYRKQNTQWHTTTESYLPGSSAVRREVKEAG